MPVVDSVPLMVCRESKVIPLTPAEDGAATERLLNVFAPVIVQLFVPLVVLVKDKL